MKVTGMNRTTEQRNLLRIYSIDKKENGICLQICSNKTEEKIEESQKKGDSDMAEFDYEVVNGRKIRVRPVETVSEVDENGYFVRQPNHFTEGFGEGKNPVEAGRYRLVWAKLCHWSNRASIVRELLGLDEAISVNMVDHADHEKNLGWEFVYDKDNVDPVLDIQFLSEAYYKADDDYTGRTTVPALIDVKTGTLARFDVAYHNIFRVNKKRLRDYDNLWAYARDLYQTPGFWDTTDFAAIKKHYHIDCNPGNIHQIIAKGPDEEAWLLPHGREKLSEK